MSGTGLAACPAAVRGILERHLAGQLSGELSLMQMLLALGDAARVHEILRSVAHACPGDARLVALRDLAHTHRRSLESTAALVRSGVTALPADGPGALEAIRAQFDRAVALAPEAAVALYSLGSGDVLERASTEITERLDAWGLLRADADLLDLGCGIGRLVRALAGRVRSIAGVDVSPGMIEEARRRCAGLPGVRLELGNGRDLAMMPDSFVDLALAIDAFPYIVAAGAHLVVAHFREVRRVLRPGGAWLMLNYSYRGDPRHDVDEVTANARLVGFDVERAGTRDLALWDGVTFLLRKPAD